MAVETITSQEDYERILRESNMPVLVKFGREGCGVCKRVSEYEDNISEDPNSSVKIIRVELPSDYMASENLSIQWIKDLREKHVFLSFPSYLLHQNGEIIAKRRESHQSEQEMRDWLDDMLHGKPSLEAHGMIDPEIKKNGPAKQFWIDNFSCGILQHEGGEAAGATMGLILASLTVGAVLGGGLFGFPAILASGFIGAAAGGLLFAGATLAMAALGMTVTALIRGKKATGEKPEEPQNLATKILKDTFAPYTPSHSGQWIAGGHNAAAATLMIGSVLTGGVAAAGIYGMGTMVAAGAGIGLLVGFATAVIASRIGAKVADMAMNYRLKNATHYPISGQPYSFA